MKKKLSLVLAMALMLALTACGGQSTSNTPPSNSTQTTPPADTSAPEQSAGTPDTLIASVVPTCYAAGSVGEVNLHIGQSADTVYLTYTSSDKAAAPVTVTGPLGTSTYPAQSVWSDSAGKYIHQAALTGLTAGTDYTYTLENGALSPRPSSRR